MTFPTVFSPDKNAYDGKGIYRYTLNRDIQRELDLGGIKFNRQLVQFIGVNPSKATETKNDPTVSRCMEWSRRWGFQNMVMTNLFAYRATDPDDMKAFPEPVGPDNDHWLNAVAEQAELIICAWGNHGEHLGRGAIVTVKLLRKHHAKMYCLGFTESGEPKHPLARGKAFIPYEFEPVPLI